MPSLRWLRPDGKQTLFSVYKNVTSIGQAGGNDVRIEAPGVSDYHAQLVFDGRDFNIIEINGVVSVNEKKKRRTKIFHHDKINVGVELTFSVFDEGMTSPTDPSADPMQTQLTGMRKLADFNRSLIEIRAVPEQLKALLDTMISVTQASTGFVVLIENGEPKITVARNVEQQNLPPAIRQLSDSILRKVIETQQPLIVSDAMHDSAFRGSDSITNLKLSSVICAPLIAQGQMLGLIYLGNDNVVSLFEQTNLDVLTIFAGQASLVLQNALLLNQLETDREQLVSQLQLKQFGDVVGSCPSVREVFRKVEKVAVTDVSVLILGETGTGKELIAREIHRRSPRSKGPFVVLNCGAIPENLMESELFGHVRGAFTGAIATRPGKFQSAHGGTLFLDEIGELPVALQAKLLRALQDKTVTKVGDTKPEQVDIRVITATNRDLERAIQDGTFREDLYYRLNVVGVHLPPLRERGDDILVIAKYLLQKYSTEFGSKVKGFTPNALVALKKYDWPGNIRQLENRIKKALVLCDTTLLGPDDLDLSPETLNRIVPLAEAREQFQRKYILEVLERNNGNRTKTAHDLDVDPRTIFRYLEREQETIDSDPPDAHG